MKKMMPIILTALFVVTCWQLAEAKTIPESVKKPEADISVVNGGINLSGVKEAKGLRNGELL